MKKILVLTAIMLASASTMAFQAGMDANAVKAEVAQRVAGQKLQNPLLQLPKPLIYQLTP